MNLQLQALQTARAGCTVALLLMSSVGTACAQTMVANFAVGTPGTPGYEQLSFYVQDAKRSTIVHVRGGAKGDDHETELKYLVGATKAGPKQFSIEFPDKRVRRVRVDAAQLRVTEPGRAYARVFRWKYAGPVNGVGTWCSSCTQSPRAATALVRKYFL